jgi:hypothetical protein
MLCEAKSDRVSDVPGIRGRLRGTASELPDLVSLNDDTLSIAMSQARTGNF